VGGDVHVGPQGAALEQEADSAFAGREQDLGVATDLLPEEGYLTRFRGEEPGENAQ
jgi:hypothetical protein